MISADAQGNTALWNAIAARHHKIFNILYHFARVSSPHHAAGDLLCLAARRGDLDTLRELLKHGLAVDSEDRDGATALRVALAEGHADVARLLVLNGASVDRAASHNEQQAAAAVSVDELRELMKTRELAHPVTIVVDSPSPAAAAVIREVGSSGDSRNGRRQSARSDGAHWPRVSIYRGHPFVRNRSSEAGKLINLPSTMEEFRIIIGKIQKPCRSSYLNLAAIARSCSSN